MIKKKPLVSVVIPVFNTDLGYLKSCFESIRNQTITNTEVVIVDDGSVDKVARFCDSFAENQHAWRVVHTANQGPSKARNRGISEVNGKYFVCIDADDSIEPTMLEELVSLAEDTSAEVIICRYDTFDGVTSNVVGQELISSYDIEDIFNISSPSIFKMMFLTSFIKKNDLQFDPELIRGEDLLFGNQALALAKNIQVTEKSLYHYRVNESGIISAKKPESMTTFLALKKLKNFLEKNNIYAKNKRSFIKLILNGTLLFDYKDNPQLFAENYSDVRKFLLETVTHEDINSDTDNSTTDILGVDNILDYYHRAAHKFKADLDYTYNENKSLISMNEELNTRVEDTNRELAQIRSSYTTIAKVLKRKIKQDTINIYNKRTKK